MATMKNNLFTPLVLVFVIGGVLSCSWGQNNINNVAAESEKVQKEWMDRLKRAAYIHRFL